MRRRGVTSSASPEHSAPKRANALNTLGVSAGCRRMLSCSALIACVCVRARGMRVCVCVCKFVFAYTCVPQPRYRSPAATQYLTQTNKILDTNKYIT